LVFLPYLPGTGTGYIIPGQGEIIVSDIPAGDGNITKRFFTVYIELWLLCVQGSFQLLGRDKDTSSCVPHPPSGNPTPLLRLWHNGQMSVCSVTEVSKRPQATSGRGSRICVLCSHRNFHKPATNFWGKREKLSLLFSCSHRNLHIAATNIWGKQEKLSLVFSIYCSLKMTFVFLSSILFGDGYCVSLLESLWGGPGVSFFKSSLWGWTLCFSLQISVGMTFVFLSLNLYGDDHCASLFKSLWGWALRFFLWIPLGMTFVVLSSNFFGDNICVYLILFRKCP